ncbi:MAG TPA: cation:dicarboxylase symporter family transporter [Chlamydiales bacterium]|nr:cation:dicarboxylase symporter family transporter [Chlamydiales bacterium]
MRLSLGYQVLLAVLLGIFCGIFFGPICTVVKPVGDIYVMLLQMVALPYISFSLIHGLGSITPEIGKKLFLRGWVFWFTLWGIIFLIIYLLSFLIPTPVVSFIGSLSVEHNSLLAKNFLNYLVPENPFYDLANNIVPAIAVFGLIVGVALMHLEKKEPILSFLERSNQMIEKILKWLAILSPIGIFAHIAVATGTVHFEDLFAIEFYVVCFILVTLFVTFWILPTLLSSLTPLNYREVMRAFKSVCLLPFATGLPTIAFPFINQYMKKLAEKEGLQDTNFHSTSQTVMPICYSFGQIGNCLILFFILFISFFYRHPFAASEKALLTILTIPMSVGSSATSINAVSFLIKTLSFPDEAVELFAETLSLTLYFQVLLSIASVLTFIILVLYSYYGLLQVKLKQLFLKLAIAFVVLGVVVWGGRWMFNLRDNYNNLYLDHRLQEVIDSPVSAKIFAKGESGTPRQPTASSQPFSDILDSGILKVGYDPEEIPYCYWNNRGELVGFDIAYAYQLARDLDCKLELIPLAIEQLGEEIAAGKYDIAMSAIIMNEHRIKAMDFTHPYTEQDNVLLVPVHKKAEFEDLNRVMATPGLRLGAIGGYMPVVERHFPLAKLIAGEQGTDIEKEFLAGKVDGWVWSYTHAFTWSLSHPQFVVADYGGLIGKRYFAYPVRSGALDWASFLNNWMILKEQSGFKAKMQRYWIDGENPMVRPPRWSIIRNVLHWVN